jgi:GWxTD domain-containing protein
MQNHCLVKLSFLFTLLFILVGCGTFPKTYRESTLDDLYPILNGGQYDSLKSLGSDEEIKQFLERFWQECDSVSSLEGGSLRAEYLQRLEYANAHFPDRPGWGRSDRKRIYLQYGPPVSVERRAFTDASLGTFSTLKSIEIWLYFGPGKNQSFPSEADGIFPGQTKFIFGDLTGSGFYSLLYSSEDRMDIDGRLLNLQ